MLFAVLVGAHLLLWRGSAYDTTGLTCSTSNASNCIIAGHFGYVDATFDVQPGGSVTVSGTYAADPASDVLYGAVNASSSLAEPSLGNNFRSVRIGDSVFRNGFE